MMAKKRKTYYLDEAVIQKVKDYAHELGISENDAFERALETYTKFFHESNQFIPLPKEYQPLLLESVDNLIYQSQRILETSSQSGLNPIVENSIRSRIDFLYEIRKRLTE